MHLFHFRKRIPYRSLDQITIGILGAGDIGEESKLLILAQGKTMVCSNNSNYLNNNNTNHLEGAIQRTERLTLTKGGQHKNKKQKQDQRQANRERTKEEQIRMVLEIKMSRGGV